MTVRCSTPPSRWSTPASTSPADGQRQLAAILGCELERLDAELDTLAARAKTRALKLRINGDVRDRARNGRYAPAREEAYFAGARIDDDELRDAAVEDEQRRAQARARHAEATRSNLGLGHDIRAGLIDPRTPSSAHSRRSSADSSSANTAS